MRVRSTIAVILMSSSLSAADSPAIDFTRDIQPILSRSCYSCHGPKKQTSGYRLDVKSIAIAGGEFGEPAVIPGNADDSPLLRYVSGLEDGLLMPPANSGKAKLSTNEIAILKRWINEGAVWPDAASTKLVDPLSHWSFQPIRSPAIPSEHSNGSSNPIDAFIGQKLAANALTPSAEADVRILVCRVYLDLHGLPPTPEEMSSYLADRRPDAWERLIDKLLASPRYGERWARHWLDVIAFGETHGFEVNTPRNNAWPYRDYVIDAFNRDTPYPQFILEQLAGDKIGKEAATGFMVASAALLSGQIGKDEESKLKARQDELNDMVATVGGAFLGLSLHCARCHDHKFDPVKQTDYYSLQAVFAGVRHGERPLPEPGHFDRAAKAKVIGEKIREALGHLIEQEPIATIAEKSPKRRAVDAVFNIERFPPAPAKFVRFTIRAVDADIRLEPSVDEIEVYNADRQNVALKSLGTKIRESSSKSNHSSQLAIDGGFGDFTSWMSNTKGSGWIELEFARPETIDAIVWGRDREKKKSDRLATDYIIEIRGAKGEWQTVATSADRLPRNKMSSTGAADYVEQRDAIITMAREHRELTRTAMVYAGFFEAPAAIHRLHRGEPLQRRELVQPGAVVSIGPKFALPAEAKEQDRRLALTEWLADPANPLPARVMVNRIWQHHFGAGIVRTPNDFGRNGIGPTHPELLDWLASEFIRGGWSMKKMHRLIVTSNTWKQSSAPRNDGMTADAATSLLWRFPPRRLEAEAIRDSMLSVAGTLDLRMGGPGYSVFEPNNNYVRVYNPKLEYGPSEWRRMIYQTKVRMAQDSTFGAFDCPDAGQALPARSRSTTPLQALNMINSGFVNQQAELFAARLARDAGTDVNRQLQRGFELAFLRFPGQEEIDVSSRLVREYGLPTFCLVLFNANEFLFLP